MRHRSRFAAIAATLAVLAGVLGLARATEAEDEDEVPGLNRKVVTFAREHVGRKVGNGLCTSLASEALRFAGARPPLWNPDGDFVWGRPVGSFREAMTGDVLQFRDAVFQGKRWVTKRRWESWSHTYPHHTAIVADVRERGRVVTVLHQNIGPAGTTDERKQVVSETTIRPESLQKGGKVWIYRPVPPEDPFRPIDPEFIP
jgi:hypothetical protein